MAEWVKAAETQLEVHRWLTSPKGLAWCRYWIQGMTQAEPDKSRVYAMNLQAEAQKLLTAEAIWVDPEMTEVIEFARESFAPEEMHMEDYIVHTGFVYFAEPILMPDRKGEMVTVGAISWCPLRFTTKTAAEIYAETTSMEKMGQGGTEIIAYGDAVSDLEQQDEWGMAITIYTSLLDDRDAFHDVHQQMRKHFDGVEIAPLHLTQVRFGDPFDDGDLYDENEEYTGADHWWKTIQTTLRLMQQRVVVQVDAEVPRATRRRWQRAGHAPPKDMMLIRLRRASQRGPKEEGEDVRHLTHRHLRVGHWRNQFYPSLNRHRQIWISQTVVGDENLPLIVKRRYWKWDR